MAKHAPRFLEIVEDAKTRIHELTVDQVKAAKPTLDYDLHYGADTGPWTTAMFIEAVYRDVTRAPKPAGGQGAKAKAPEKGKK